MYATQQLISFTSGELSPWMGARIDMDQYVRGASLLRNFLVKPYGGLERRGGSRWIGFTKNNTGSVRLFAFKYAQGDQYVLELGLGYVRFYTSAGIVLNSNGKPYEIETPWDTGSMLKELRLTQVNDVVYGVCSECFPHMLSRYGELDWRVKKCPFSPFPRETSSRQSASMTYAPLTDSASAVIKLTCSEDVFIYGMPGNERIILRCEYPEQRLFEKSLPQFNGTLAEDVTTATLKEGDQFYQTLSTGWLNLFTCRTDVNGADLVPKVGNAEFWGQYFRKGYFVMEDGYPYEVCGDWELTTSGTWNAAWELWRSYDTIEEDGENFYNWEWECIRTFRQDSYSERKNWSLSGSESTPCHMVLVCTSCASFSDMGKPVFRILSGYADYEMAINLRINARIARADLVHRRFRRLPGGKTYQWSFGAFGIRNGYPTAIAFHQGRLWMAGTPGQPTTLRASATDDFYNFGLGSDDTASLSLTLAATNQNAIRWICPMKQMLLGTSEGEWVLSSSDSSSALTASNAAFSKQSAVGSDPLEASCAENAVFFVQRGGSKLREISYKLEADGFTTTDMSLLSDHLTEGGIAEWTIQRADANFVWCIVRDGTAAVLTHYPDQQVLAWHRQEIQDARIERAVCITDAAGENDELWMITVREIDGEERRCIEVLSRSAPWLDAHVLINADTEAKKASLPHLAKKTVTAYPISAPTDNHTLEIDASGDCQLPESATGTWVIGLPYESSLQTMPLDRQEYFDSVIQQPQFKIRLLESAPIFRYKLAHVDTWETYDASRDCIEYPWSGNIKLSQIPSPASPVSLCLSTSVTGPFRILSLSAELAYHGK